MPSGGHGRVGRAIDDAATRKLHGAETRKRHRAKESTAIPGQALVCDPPPALSKPEREFWDYYAPLLAAERRLDRKTRDTLAKYCSGLAVVASLRAALFSRKKADLETRSANRKELRQWVLALRLYENDLVLNPASAIRAPKVDVPPPIDPEVAPDSFDREFDDDGDGKVM